MSKYKKYIAPAMLAAGAVLVIFAVACLCSAGKGIGSLEDTYYYLGMNLHHGRFGAGDAGEVIGMLRDMGIADAVIGGFEVFSIYARFPLLIAGVLLAAAGAVLMLRRGFAVPEGAGAFAALAIDRIKKWIAAAWLWINGIVKGARCPVCGGKLTKEARFCGLCGAQLTADTEHALCPDCGAQLEGDANFCNSCGRDMKEQA